MENIKVSVIIPVFNVEKYLEGAISSMVNQTLDNIEIIIVNNGSTDKCNEIINKYLSMYPDKIISIDAEQEFSPGYARNIALNYAVGEYVYFMDSDDLAKVDLLETLYKAAKLEDVNIASLWGKGLEKCSFLSEDDRRLILPGECNNGYKVIDTLENPGFIYDDSMTVWPKLFKREIIPNRPFITDNNMEDLPFCCSLDLSQRYIAFCNEGNGYGYRIRRGSITRLLDGVTPDILSIINSCYYGLSFAKKVGLDDKSLAKARDIYKKYLIFWLDRINSWNIPQNEKVKIMQQFCSIANSLFGMINKPEFFERYKYSNSLCRMYDDIIDDSGYTDNPEKQLILLKNDLISSRKMH